MMARWAAAVAASLVLVSLAHAADGPHVGSVVPSPLVGEGGQRPGEGLTGASPLTPAPSPTEGRGGKAAALNSHDWPQWRGPDRTGAIEGGPALAEAWPKEGPVKVWESEPLQAGGTGGAASPVVADGRVYIYATENRNGQQTEIILSLDAATGKTLWKVQWPRRPHWNNCGSSTICVSGGRLYGLGDGSAYCLDARTGKTIWKVGCAGGSCSPLVEDGLVVAMTGGHDQWTGSGELIAFDAVRGVRVWTQPAVRGGHNSPALWRSGRKKYVIYNSCSTEKIACVDLKDGKVLWTVGGGGSSSTPAVSGDILVVNSGKSGLAAYRLTATKPEEIWRLTAINGAVYGDGRPGGVSPVIYKGRVYAIGGNKTFCVDLLKGTIIWEGPNGGGNWHSLIVSGDRLFVPSNRFIIQMIRAGTNKYEELAMSRGLDIGECTTPTVVDGYLYLRQNKGVVACYDLAKVKGNRSRNSTMMELPPGAGGGTVKYLDGFLRRLDQGGPVKPVLEELKRIAENAKEPEKAEEAKAIIAHFEAWGQAELERAKALETQVPTDAEKAYQNLVVRFGGLEPAKTAQERLQDKKFQDDLRSWALVERMQAAEKRLKKDVPGAPRSAKDVEAARVNAANLAQIKAAAQTLAQQGASPWIIEEANAVLERCSMEKLDKPSAATAPSAPNADLRR